MRRVVCALVLVFVSLPAGAHAAPQDVANLIASRMMSPYCDGVTLHECPSAEAAALRDRITDWADQGYTTSQIEARLEQEFGEGIWGAPPASGAGLWAWLLPAMVTIAATMIAWHYLRRWAVVRGRPEGYDPDRHVTKDDRRRLDGELAKLRGRV